MTRICLDASLIVKWLTPEEGSVEALQLYKRWVSQRIIFIAPSLLDYEVGTVLRQKIVRGLLHVEDVFPICDLYHRLGILLFHTARFVEQAVSAAATLGEPTAYDVAYLLVAKQQRTELITADERFFQRAKALYPFVRFYRELIHSWVPA